MHFLGVTADAAWNNGEFQIGLPAKVHIYLLRRERRHFQVVFPATERAFVVKSPHCRANVISAINVMIDSAQE